MTSFIIVVVLFVAIVFGYNIWKGMDQHDKLKAYERRLVEAEQDYKKSLRGADKVEALEKGRKFYSTLRGNNTLTIMDETQIMNDLNAHTNLK